MSRRKHVRVSGSSAFSRATRGRTGTYFKGTSKATRHGNELSQVILEAKRRAATQGIHCAMNESTIKQFATWVITGNPDVPAPLPMRPLVDRIEYAISEAIRRERENETIPNQTS